MASSKAQISLFPKMVRPDVLGLESRRYIGSKAKLTEWIFDTIRTEAEGARSFFDLFAGTATVSNSALGKFSKVI